MRWRVIITAGICILATGLPVWGADVVGVVVSTSIADADLTRERVIDLLNGRVVSLPSGRRAVLVLSHGPQGEIAVRNLMDRDVSRLMRGWKRLVFGAGGSLPLVAEDDREALDMAGRTVDVILPLTQPAGDLPTGLHFIPLQ